MKVQLIAQGPKGSVSLEDALSNAAGLTKFDQLEVAVAYATLQGIKTLAKLLSGLPAESWWIIGLDDAISQPEAIEHLLALPNAHVRLATLAPQRRFHPKLYCLSSSTHPDRGISVVGSGNMTLNGLRKNGEAAVLLTAENAAETQTLREQWSSLWALGTDATQAAVDDYKVRYKAARKARKIVEDLGAAPPEPEPDAPVELPETVFDGTPASASVAWTEGASPSAGGRDLEFPRLVMPFFGLARSPVTKRFHMPNGQSFLLTFTMRDDNQMWRLLFSRESIRAAIGRETLRPVAGGNRSDLAIVFKRRPDHDYDIRMVVIGSGEHDLLLQRSRAAGQLHRTRDPGGRFFGIY